MQKSQIDTSIGSVSTQSIVQTSQRTKENLTKFLQSISPECKQIMQTIASIEQDLRLRIKMYGQDSSQTFECLQHFVITCNDHALHLIKLGEFRVATEILHQCEYLLLSPIGQNYPNFKFQTFNNLAHSHNVQANVRLSLKYLLRSLDYALQIDGVEQPQMNRQQPLISLVETYLNICNAYSFLSQYEPGLEYAEKAILLSYKLINDLMEILNDQNLTPDDRDFFTEQFHSQVNLHAMSFHTKGQIYEKLKQLEEAIMEYQSGKQVIETNYGHQHKQCIEFINAINAVKLKIKYFQHSNLPGSESASNILANRKPSLEANVYTNLQVNSQGSTVHQNLFLQEQEKIKPISQQQKKKIRPSSAKLQKDQAYFSKQIVPILNQSINHELIHKSNSQRTSSKGASIAKIKNRSLRRVMIPGGPYLARNVVTVQSPSFSAKSTVSSGLDHKGHSSQRKKLVRKIRNFHNAPAHQNHNSHKECGDCHKQIEEIRRLQIEQQKLVNLVVQSQSVVNLNSQQLQANVSPFQNSQSSATIQNFQHHQTNNSINQQYQMQQMQNSGIYNQNLQMSNSFQNGMPMGYPAPYPFYYPYGPPPQYMLPPPPPQYGYYPSSNVNGYGTGIFLPPMRTQHPMTNNYMNSSQSQQDNMRSTPDKIEVQIDQDSQKSFFPQYQHQEQQKQSVSSLKHSSNQYNIVTPDQRSANSHLMPNFYPKMHSDDKGPHHHMMQSTYTDINERDSRFGEDFERELRETKISQSNGFQYRSQFANPNLQNTDEKTLESQRNPWKKEEQPSMKKIKRESQRDVFEKLKVAAIKIQKYYRRYACQKNFKQLLAQRRQKFQFHRQIYAHKQNKKSPKQVLLIASLIVVLEKNQNMNKKQPQMVTLEIYVPNDKKIIFEQQLTITQLGFNKSTVTNIEIFNKVKNMLSQLHLTGDPKNDLIDQLQDLLKKLGKHEYKQTIVFIEPQYFSEGLELIKNIKVDKPPPQRRKSSSSSSEKFKQESAQDEEPIDESIEDNYSDFKSEKGDQKKDLSLSKSSSESIKPLPVQIPVVQPIKQKSLSSKSSKKSSSSHSEEEAYEAFEEEPIEDDYEDKLNDKLSQSLSQKSIDKPLKMDELSKSSKKSSVKSESDKEEVIDSDEEILRRLVPVPQPPKLILINKKKLEQAAITIQKKARQFIAKKDCENKKKSKVKLCQYVVINLKDSAQVTITEKFKKKNSKVKMVVKNLKKEMKKNSIKKKLQRNQLPKQEEFVAEYVKKHLIISWIKGRIVDAEFNPSNANYSQNPQQLKMKRNYESESESESDKEEEKESISQHSVVEEEIEQEKPVESDSDQGYSQLDEGAESEKYEDAFYPKNKVLTFEELLKMEKEEASIVSSQQTSFVQTKEKAAIKPVNQKQLEYQRKLIKAQALVRGHLTRVQYNHLINPDEARYTMIARQCRRLSDGKLYFIFLMSSKLNMVRSSNDPFYIVILREVENINEIYDLELSLDVAKRIFVRNKNASTAEVNSRIMFKTNRAEFMMMLECLDIVNEDFSLNFKKFREMQDRHEQLRINTSNHQDHARQMPVQNKRKDSESPSSSSSSSSSSDSDNDKKKKKQAKTQIINRNNPKIRQQETIQEADSRFEASPIQQLNPKQASVVPPPKQKIQQPVPQKKKNKLKAIDKKIIALIMIQAQFRKFLAIKRAEKVRLINFHNQSEDPSKHLKLFKQGIFKSATLYFMYMLYCDSSRQFVKVTIKEVSKKITIISQKTIMMSEFGDQDADIEDIPDYIRGLFDDNCEDVILDQKTGSLRKDWISQLHSFLSENL
ncbi:tpr domain containing protein [Stylonychia lemnae]|uniref:Tpr domain containing protein n=1 Tax=Stylonychia lemnae TaxID=5949 RepID=A0A078A0F9_STYLE|nr:tpr domain containing protein [Stylonychia lemnae]|eukprot:CDW74268.1 tpr domain containing protein [Stylonychia lemnae]